MTRPLTSTATSSASAERVGDVLLDDQERGAGITDGREGPVHLVDDDRRQAERQLVAHQEPRRLRQHPRQGEHALLAARERARDLPPALPQRGEHLVGASEAAGRPRPPERPPEA